MVCRRIWRKGLGCKNCRPMPNNHVQEIRECHQQAVQCVQQAEAQNDAKVKKQFLELTRLWLLLAHGYESAAR